MMAAMVVFVVVTCGLSGVCFHRIATGSSADETVGAYNVLALIGVGYRERKQRLGVGLVVR